LYIIHFFTLYLLNLYTSFSEFTCSFVVCSFSYLRTVTLFILTSISVLRIHDHYWENQMMPPSHSIKNKNQTTDIKGFRQIKQNVAKYKYQIIRSQLKPSLDGFVCIFGHETLLKCMFKPYETRGTDETHKLANMTFTHSTKLQSSSCILPAYPCKTGTC